MMMMRWPKQIIKKTGEKRTKEKEKKKHPKQQISTDDRS